MSKLGNELIQSMAEALAHARGEKMGAKVYKVKPSEARKARETLGLVSFEPGPFSVTACWETAQVEGVQPE